MTRAREEHVAALRALLGEGAAKAEEVVVAEILVEEIPAADAAEEA